MKMKQFRDRLANAIQRSPITRYELSKQSGVSESILSRFVNGERGMSLDSIDSICAVLEVELTTRFDREKLQKRKRRK